MDDLNLDFNDITPKKANGSKTRKIIAIIVALLLLVVAGLFGFRYLSEQGRDEVKIENAIKAELGQLENKTNDEIETELNRVIEKGSMAISINMNPVFVDGTSEGSLQIENSPANHYAQEVVITMNDTGEVIYRSGLLLPNYHIQNDVLLVDLDAGDYECTATFTAYDLELAEDMVQTGQAVAKIRISVLS